MVVHAGHPLAQRDDLALTELVSDWPWILQPETSPARIGFDEALQRLALPQPADIIECSSVYSMQQLIQLTDAIMVLSESALRDYLKMGLVVALPVALQVQLAPFGMLLRRGDPVSRELGMFIDMLRQKAAML